MITIEGVSQSRELELKHLHALAGFTLTLRNDRRRAMSPAHTDPDEAAAVRDLRIVLIGKSEAGKSSIGNIILGRDAFKEIRTRESEIQRGRVEDRSISIIDTPGFFNPHLTDEELKKQMMKSLDLSDPGPHVFLLVIRLDRFTEDVVKIVKKIHEHFGKDAFRFTMVLFTGREAMSKREWIEFRLDRKTRELLSFCEEKCDVIIHKNKRDRKQIASLLENIDEVVRKNGREHYVKEVPKNGEDETRTTQVSGEKEHRIRQEETENRVQKETEDGNQSDKQHETCLIDEEKKATPENQSVTASDLRIVLLGKSGSGKSSTANTILGRDASKIHKSFPSSPQTFEKQSGGNISVIDTPGLFDPQLKAEIETCVEMSSPGPHVFLLVVRLDEAFTDEEKNTVKWIQENIGEKAVHRTIILFTHADLLKGRSLEEFIRDSPDLQTFTESFGGRFHSFNNEDTRNRSQVTELLEKIEKLVEGNGGSETFITFQGKTVKEKEEKVKENPSRWLKGLVIFVIGALAAAAVAQSGFEG